LCCKSLVLLVLTAKIVALNVIFGVFLAL